MRLLFISLVFIAFIGCNKIVNDADIDRSEVSGPPFGTVDDVRQLLEMTADFRSFWDSVKVDVGRPMWSHTLYKNEEKEDVFFIPLVKRGSLQVSGVAIVSISDSAKIKVVEKDRQPAANAGILPSRNDMLIHYFDHRLRKIQPLAGKGIHFIDERLDSSKSRGTITDTRVPYTLSICYTITVCTGDGSGNCTGNYRYYTDCYTSTYWLESYNIGRPVGGGAGSDGGTRPGGGGGNGSATYLLPPQKRITDLNEYLSCFKSSAPGKLTVFVDQPQPGSDEPFTILGKMGHVFLSLEQVVDGVLIRRFFGFHPNQKVNPFGKKNAPSILANDEGRISDIHISFDLDKGHFDGALAAIRNFNPTYDLEEYNCTDFAIDVAEGAGVSLPRTTGWWILGRGRNPGSLGEDLRRLPASVSGTYRAPAGAGLCK